MRIKTRRADPSGYLEDNFDALHEAGCLQAARIDIFAYGLYRAIYEATYGNPCAGCPQWQDQGEKCLAFQKYHTASKANNKDKLPDRLEPATKPGNRNGKAWEGMSITQIAARLGVSKSEVRRLKQAGKLEGMGC